MHRIRFACLFCFLAFPGLSAELYPHRGAYAIWVKPEVADSLTFLKGGQVYLQWASVEPKEGQYDFSDLRRQLEHQDQLGRMTTLQVNGNSRPGYLFDRVPYHSKKLNPQNLDKQGTLQYWHPNHVKAYTRLIAAYARELKASPLRSRVIAIRLNFNAIGTEFMDVAPEDRDPSQWVCPPGVEPGPPWTPQIAAEYRRTVVDAFIKDFTPEIPVFLRTGIMRDPTTDPEVIRLAQAGKLGLFTTGSEIEPDSERVEKGTYQLFLEYCRTGKTVCYAEPKADARGFHAGIHDPRWCGPEQYAYWRILSDLHLGASIVAMYGADLARAREPEFNEAFQFAARYAGYHVSPEVSPGAWVALREGNRLKGDYTFHMSRLPGDGMTALQKAGPEDQRFGAWARTLAKGAVAKFALDPAFARSLEGRKARLRVIYLDGPNGNFTIRASKREFKAALSGSGRWKTAEFALDRASFAAGGDGSHISIAADTDVTLHMIEVMR